MQVEEIGLSDWERALPSDGFDVFHSPEALRVIDQHSTGKLRLFGGFRGDEAVGLCPIHVESQYGVRVLTSPALGFGIRRLGPLLMAPSPKKHKKEATTKEFIRGILNAVEADGSLTVVRIACTPRFRDPRVFTWSGFKVTPLFTYRLDLNDVTSDEVLSSFSRDLRRVIRKRDQATFSIRRGGIDSARHIYESLDSRYREQNLRFPLSWEIFRDLIDHLGEDRSRIYVAESPDGEFMSGMAILYSNDTAYFWKGGAKSTDTRLSPNDLLHWKVIRDILSDSELDSIDHYDLYTANNERLAEYKSKFGGNLAEYYIVESNGVLTSAAKSLYRLSETKTVPLRVRDRIGLLTK